MTITLRTFLAAAGAIAALAGLLFLAIPATVGDGATTVPSTCGSAFAPDEASARDAADLDSMMAPYRATRMGATVTSACSDALGTRRVIGWPLLIVGLLAAAGALVVRQAQTTVVEAEVTQPQA